MLSMMRTARLTPPLSDGHLNERFYLVLLVGMGDEIEIRKMEALRWALAHAKRKSHTQVLTFPPCSHSWEQRTYA